MSNEEIAALWEAYKEGPDYSNVHRWLCNGGDPDKISENMRWLFRSAILCATWPPFLEPGIPQDDDLAGAEGTGGNADG